MFDRKNVIAIKNPHEGQFQYLGRWVNKEHFRAFVWNENGEQRLAESYKEFESLTASGVWFASKPVPVASKERKHKNGITSSNS